MPQLGPSLECSRRQNWDWRHSPVVAVGIVTVWSKIHDFLIAAQLAQLHWSHQYCIVTCTRSYEHDEEIYTVMHGKRARARALDSAAFLWSTSLTCTTSTWALDTRICVKVHEKCSMHKCRKQSTDFIRVHQYSQKKGTVPLLYSIAIGCLVIVLQMMWSNWSMTGWSIAVLYTLVHV